MAPPLAKLRLNSVRCAKIDVVVSRSVDEGKLCA